MFSQELKPEHQSLCRGWQWNVAQPGVLKSGVGSFSSKQYTLFICILSIDLIAALTSQLIIQTPQCRWLKLPQLCLLCSYLQSWKAVTCILLVLLIWIVTLLRTWWDFMPGAGVRAPWALSGLLWVFSWFHCRHKYKSKPQKCMFCFLFSRSMVTSHRD